MIILDTNVVSELARLYPDEGMLAWLDSLPTDEVCTTAMTAAEMLHGVDRMPEGRRKADLAVAVQGLLDDFRGRIEPFDTAAALHYATVITSREKVGRPITVPAAQIAAICRKTQATLATRNIKDFEQSGLELVNPWSVRAM